MAMGKEAGEGVGELVNNSKMIEENDWTEINGCKINDEEK